MGKIEKSGTKELATISKEETLFTVASHIMALGSVGGLVLNFAILLIKGKDSEYIRHHAKEVLNLQISLLAFSMAFGIVYTVVYLLTLFVMPEIAILSTFLIIPAFGLLLLAILILVIRGAIHASKGKLYKYPFIIRLVKNL